MERLEKELSMLKLELEEMQKQWSDEVKAVTQQPKYDKYSVKTEKAFNKIAERYAEQMNDNIFAQAAIEQEIARIKEEERKKLYKD